MKRVRKEKKVDVFGREYTYYKIINEYDTNDTELPVRSKRVDKRRKTGELEDESLHNGTTW